MGGLLETLLAWIRRTVGRVGVRSGVGGANYRAVPSELVERIKSRLEDSGLSIPFPLRDLHIVSQPAAGQ